MRQTGLFTFGIICTLLWAMIVFLAVMAQPIGPGRGESIGLTALLLLMFGPPLAVTVAALLRTRRFGRKR